MRVVTSKGCPCVEFLWPEFCLPAAALLLGTILRLSLKLRLLLLLLLILLSNAVADEVHAVELLLLML